MATDLGRCRDNWQRSRNAADSSSRPRTGDAAAASRDPKATKPAAMAGLERRSSKPGVSRRGVIV